jgi:hypothetical protein
MCVIIAILILIKQPTEKKMIVQTVNENQFIDAFRTWDTYKDNFSYEGLKALYEELEEVSEYNDSKTIELDVVAICCDYTEYENFQEFLDNYGDKYKYIFGGNNDCLDYYTSIILPNCWQGKDVDNHEEIKDLPFIIQQF